MAESSGSAGRRGDWRSRCFLAAAYFKRNPVRLPKLAELGDAGDLLRVLDEREGRGSDAGEPLDVLPQEPEVGPELLQPPGQFPIFARDVGHTLDIINPQEALAQLNIARATSGSGPSRLKLPMTGKNKEGRRQPVYMRAVGEVLHMMRILGISQKQAALGVGMSESQFSQKKVGIENHFSPEEFEDLRQFFRTVTDRPLIGFPHLDRDLQDAVDRKVGGWQPPTSKS